MKTRQGLGLLLFAVSLVLLQFVGYAFVPLLVGALLLLFSAQALQQCVQSVPLFAAFTVASLLIGLFLMMARPTEAAPLARWIQFYFLVVMLMGVGDKRRLLMVVSYVVYAIFAADLLANILQVAGVKLPWVYLTIRPGELIPRFQGIKGNSLYSGSISFLALCFLINETGLERRRRRALAALMVVNLLLAGSLRYFISLSLVAALIVLRLYRHRARLLTVVCATIGFVVLLTRWTMGFSESNYFRWKLWGYTIDRIGDHPLLGHGFLFQRVTEHTRFSVRTLATADVTESTVLLFGLSFGLPVMLLFVASLFHTLSRYVRYPRYAPELGLFLGLALDLFWGGSIDNVLSLSVLLLSMYLIHLHPQTLPRV